MLKRQRPASPSPHYGATEDAKSLPEDLFEPMSKRRRYFAAGSTDSVNSQSYENNDDEDEQQVRSSCPPFRPNGVRKWQKYAGEYKEENTKLHDLHAEQRHRLLFTTDNSANRGLLASLASNMEAHNVACAQHSRGSAYIRLRVHIDILILCYI